MKKIFVGFIFLLLEFQLIVNGGTYEIHPGFFGYMFLMTGFEELKNEDAVFAKLQKLSSCMIIYTIVLAVINYAKIIPSSLYIFSLVLWWIGTAMRFYMAYRTIDSFKVLEKKYSCSLESEKVLRSAVLCLGSSLIGSFIYTAAYVVLLMISFGTYELLMTFSYATMAVATVTVVLSVLFMVKLKAAVNKYESVKKDADSKSLHGDDASDI